MKKLPFSLISILLVAVNAAHAADNKPHPPSLLIETTRNADRQSIDDLFSETGCTIIGEAHS
ncbi:MAG: hypothetical protein JST44_05105, partial [Cyanobacteria bacterium SZAS LIN-5]|nr:hypothetical protein [Cyanobacteria bacterium SZAS LIN-5]